MKYPRFSLLSLLFALTIHEAFAEGMEIKTLKGGATEQHDRNVDRVALSAQEKAIAKLSTLLKKYRGKMQEPSLLLKLAELQQQNASIHFRIAHGSAKNQNKGLDLASYKRTMRLSISTLTELIKKYPGYDEIPQAYFMRGKGHEEIGDKDPATRDYLHLVGRYPEVPEATAAYMSLAEFSIQANDHLRAIAYLKEVEKKPEDARYPFSLYKLAWSYYNLKDIPKALGYAERHVSYYKNPETTSDAAFRENMLLDSTSFLLEGYEQKLPQYRISEALPYFRSLDPGPVLGKMMLRFAKLLRSHSHESDLIAWKDLVLASESERSESLDTLLIVYEDQLNKRRYAQLPALASDIVKLHRKHPKYESFPKAQKTLLDTADGLQAVIIKNKGAEGVLDLSVTLAAIYDAFTQIVDDADPRIPGVHYNLAETLFEIKEYDKATKHYRWIVEHGKWSKKEEKNAISVRDASLKAVSSRYEVLRSRHLIPGDIKPRSLEDDKDKDLEPALQEWVEWVDLHADKAPGTADHFLFEANRTLYGQGRIAQSVERLRKYASKNPASKFAIPSASLALDTWIASQKWEEAHELAEDFLDIDEWKKQEFSKKLFAAASDSYYKIIESLYQAKDYKGALKRADKFLDRYGKSQRLSDTLTLAGNSALSLKDPELANRYYSRLIAEAPQAATIGQALLARASIHEERYEFAEAARDFRDYLGRSNAWIKHGSGEIDKLRQKVLTLAWLSADARELRQTLASPAVCTKDEASTCDRYQALLSLQDTQRGLGGDIAEAAMEKAKKGVEENRAIWAAVALEGSKDLNFRDRLLLIRRIGSHGTQLPALVHFTLGAHLSRSIPTAFQMNRAGMDQVAPLKANEKHITRRVEAIREMENAATEAMKLPWTRVRASVLNELAGLYLDLARGLKTLPAPKDLAPADMAAYEETIQKLVLPFEEKGQEMRIKAFEIASRFSIEDDSFASVAEPFFLDNPSQAKSLRPAGSPGAPVALQLPLLDQWDPSGDWDSLKNRKQWDAQDSEERAEHVQWRWADALKNRKWPQAAFFIQEASEKKLFSPLALGMVKAISFAGIGARAEGLQEVELLREKANDLQAKEMTLFLLQYSVRSCNREKTKAWVEAVRKLDPENEIRDDGTHGPLWMLANNWLSAK